MKKFVLILILAFAIPMLSSTNSYAKKAVVKVMATITAELMGDCNEVYVTSTKDLSNVVVMYEMENGEFEMIKYEDLEGYEGTFSAPGVIVTVWVKSGNNKSGDGPGFGERFDLECGTWED